jgi:NADPH:quinone reductase-like Zn-dependent oxidoreductase
VSYEFHFMRADGEQLRQIAELVDAGAIRPIVGATYTFDEAPTALESLHVGGIRGKAVLLGASSPLVPTSSTHHTQH